MITGTALATPSRQHNTKQIVFIFSAAMPVPKTLIFMKREAMRLMTHGRAVTVTDLQHGHRQEERGCRVVDCCLSPCLGGGETHPPWTIMASDSARRLAADETGHHSVGNGPGAAAATRSQQQSPDVEQETPRCGCGLVLKEDEKGVVVSVSKIRPGSPAALCGKLAIGDEVRGFPNPTPKCLVCSKKSVHWEVCMHSQREGRFPAEAATQQFRRRDVLSMSCIDEC